jgi:TRAP-type C4-dicarboxylate transport system substrate-binding protein
MIGDQRWKTLPPDVQKAMIEAGDATWRNFCRAEDADTPKIAALLVQKQHWTLHTLTAGERTQWKTAMEPVQRQWAQQLDHRGLPGSKVLAAFRALVEPGAAK